MKLSKKIMIIFGSVLILFKISSFAWAIETSELRQTIAEPTLVEEQNNIELTLQNNVSNLESRMNGLDNRISNLESQVNHIKNGASIGLVSFLFGAFCALWAQNTRRNALGWFIGGALLNVIAVLILLWHNHNDQNQPPYRVS